MTDNANTEVDIPVRIEGSKPDPTIEGAVRTVEGTPPETDLFTVIATVESAINYRAVRFEPATYERLSASRSDSQKAIIATIQLVHGCSWGTALMIFSTSFGATQIMGFNLYGQRSSYRDSFFAFCDDDMEQLNSFYEFVGHDPKTNVSPKVLASSASARIAFAMTYNGSPSYADNIVAALKSLHFNVTN